MRLSFIAIAGILIGSAYLMLPSVQELARRTCRDDAGEQLLAGANIGDQAMWEEALDRQPSPDVRNSTGWTPLMFAASRGDVALVQRLIRAGADVEAKSDDAITPLWAAALSGRDAVVLILLRAGAAIDEPSFRGGTALHAAVSQAHRDTVKLLLKSGADVNHRDIQGNSALMALTYCGESDVSLASDLISAGADLGATNQDGFSVAHIAAAEGRADLASVFCMKGESQDQYAESRSFEQLQSDRWFISTWSGGR